MRIFKFIQLLLAAQLRLSAYGQFCLPLKHLTLTSAFGFRVHPVTGKFAFHAGIDLRAHSDTVFAIAHGVVTATGYNNFLGIYIRMDHAGLHSSYGHLSTIWVMAGDTVVSGQAIAITGATGQVTGEHLHFSLVSHGKPLDAIKFLYHLLKYNQNHE